MPTGNTGALQKSKVSWPPGVSSRYTGTAIMQHDDKNKLRVMAYVSRVLNKAATGYSDTLNEALAVVWCLCILNL